jgi:hypothetical protein
MVYMPSDVLGWRPAVRTWLEQYLSTHFAAQLPGDAASSSTPAGTLQTEPSQLESPGSPTLPGFGRAGMDSFNAAIRGGAAPAAAAAAVIGDASANGQQVPQEMVPLCDFVWGMFDKFAEPLLQWVASKGVQAMQLSATSLMSSVTTLLEVQLDTLAG